MTGRAMRPARPTLRCLRDDLGLPVPAVTDSLDEIEHPILAKAAERFTANDAKHERIRAVDDQVLFKVKVQRWRGAVWVDADGKAARTRYNADNADALKSATHTAHLLAARQDHVRYRAEAGVRFVRRLRTTIVTQRPAV